mgnify:CR=1 FL=1
MSEYKGYDENQAKAYKKYMQKKATIMIRMTPEQKEQISDMAKKENKSVNQYILDKCLNN